MFTNNLVGILESDGDFGKILDKREKLFEKSWS